MLTAAEIAAMRATQAEALPDECVIARPTMAPTAQGGQKEGAPTVIATERCRVSVVSRESERIQGGRYADAPQYLFTLEHGSQAQVGDYLTYDGVGYVVLGRLADGAWATATRLIAARVA